LSPVKQGIELAKMTAKLAISPPPSNVPKPIPVLRGVNHEAIDPRDPERGPKLSIKAWMDRRQKQVDEEWEKSRPQKRTR
jgi:hypothetical protein